MKFFDLLSNKVCGLPAQTIDAFAHRFRAMSCRFRKRNTTAIPSESSISNPAAFPASWSDPDPRFSVLVNNRKSPLSFEINHFRVRNEHSSEWIHDLDRIALENKFWSHPHDVGDKTEADAEYEFENCLQRFGNYIEAVDGEEKNQHVRHTCKNKVPLRAKGFTHAPSIAGHG